MDNTSVYNPYVYNPRLQSFFQGSGNGTPSGAPMSADYVNQAIVANPDLGAHISAVWSFLGWLKQSSPDFYKVLTNAQPTAADPVNVVLSGALSPSPDASVPTTGRIMPVTPWGNWVADLATGFYGGVTAATTLAIIQNISSVEQGQTIAAKGGFLSEIVKHPYVSAAVTYFAFKMLKK